MDEHGKITDERINDYLRTKNNLIPPSTVSISGLKSSPSPASISSVDQLNDPVTPSLGYDTTPTQIPESHLITDLSHTLKPPSEEMIEMVNQYDQGGFESQEWLHLPEGSKSWIAKGNRAWNPVASCYTLVYYIFKILKWPLGEMRLVVNYHKGTVKFSKVIGEVFQKYKIMDKFNESDIITKVVVWMIASMNSFGVIRPLFLQSSTNNAFKIHPLCAMKQNHEKILYFVTWPMKLDSKNIYILHNQTKVKTFSVDDFRENLHVDCYRGRKILKMIPDWIYKMVV